jgi:hypothetical protein
MNQAIRLAAPRRSPSSSAAMIGARAMIASATVLTLICGCGPPANTPVPAPPIAARPDVIVTIDGKSHSCVVALYSEAQGSTISCEDVTPFVRDELRLASGSSYDIRANSGADETITARVEASLTGAGYRFIGGTHAGPHDHR